MLNLRNTNQLQTIGEIVSRGAAAPAIPTATINYRFEENLANGRLIILDDGSSIVDITSSLNGILNVDSASVVSASLSGIGWPATGSTSMSLFITGANVSYNQTSLVSSSALMTNFTALSGAVYIISASVNHNPATGSPFVPGEGTFAYGFVKGGTVSTPGKLTVFNYIDQNGASQSVAVGQYQTSSTDAPFIYNTVIGFTISGSEGNEQIWSSPYTSSFVTGSSSSCVLTTFNNPNPSSPASNNFWLAAYIPCNSTTFAFRLVPPGQSFANACSSYKNDIYFSPGGAFNLNQTQFTTGSAC